MIHSKEQPKNIGAVIWNINGLGGKHKYLGCIIDERNPEVVILSETKMKRPIVPHIDVGCDNYDVIQVKSTTYSRGGMVVLVKKGLKLILDEVIRKEYGNNFIHAVILKNDRGEALVGWYNSPGTSQQYFYDELKNTLTKHKLHCLAGDLNARHPRWCTAHDDQRRGQRLMKLATELKDVTVYAPEGPTFEALKCKEIGEMRRSTVHLILGRDEVGNIRRI